MSNWNDTRQIAARLVVTGDLVLQTPAHLGSGESGDTVDMVLLKDAQDRPLLPSTSIAGALRSYLRAYERGDFGQEQTSGAAALLFGGTKGDEDAEQSPLIVEDALAKHIIAEVRDGVRINPKTRTAEDKFKFDIELLPPGTIFSLRFELLLPDDPIKAIQMKAALALALHGLEHGEIPIGARKSRGYGFCTVNGWVAKTYHLAESRHDLLAWLTVNHADWGYALPLEHVQTGDATTILGSSDQKDKRNRFTISATFTLTSPILIRSEEPLTMSGNQPDVAHLRDGQGKPIISGTSLAGALRARAGRILSVIGHPNREKFLNQMFGKDMQHDRKDPTASRLIVHESRIEAGKYIVQNRVGIDRFTGGAFDTALFGEAPHVGGSVTLTLTLRGSEDAEKGLLLLLLKDLWTSDLPLGGTSSIGRGRLCGQQALIRDGDDAWTLSERDKQLHVPDAARTHLEQYVSALGKEGSHAQ